ncbi:restriction endonuclease [Candidatus Woesearchaeota archaeon]|nr:restriction endonuclease [Candidatus Woesearchaeota archaeon]
MKGKERKTVGLISISSTDLGRSFERRVLDAFLGNGYVRMKKNHWMRNYDFISDPATKREYDLVLMRISSLQVYVLECKAHYSSDSLVGLEEVTEFHIKLVNYNGLRTVPLMVTDSGFTRCAKQYAGKNRISLVSGADLLALERSASLVQRLKGRFLSVAYSSAEHAFGSAVRGCL